jgi:quercetin dioxygenase-like cupin family protein
VTGTLIDPEEVPWQARGHPTLGIPIDTRWKLIFSGERTPTQAMTFGLAEFPPGTVLPLHRHEPAEIYHVLSGEGVTEIDGEPHRLRPGVSLFIPSNARHRTTNTGSETLRLLFVFPTSRFEEVVYHFDE